MSPFTRLHVATLTVLMVGCSSEMATMDTGTDVAATLDAPSSDSGAADATASDTSATDAGVGDADIADSGAGDTGADDTGAGASDAGDDAGDDDAGALDAGEGDAGVDLCAALSCDTMDTACLDYTCDGDACTAAPRTGAACDDGSPSTGGDACDASGICVGTSLCALPANACADGMQNRIGCGGSAARVIGRRPASGGSGTLINGNTCSAASAFNRSDCAFDGGPDHSYRIWLRAGESLSVRLRRMSDCTTGAMPTWDATLQLFESTGCDEVTCDVGLWCHGRVGTTLYPYTASHDGWIVIVVDGVAGVGDEGAYRLEVQLTGCATAGCEC